MASKKCCMLVVLTLFASEGENNGSSRSCRPGNGRFRCANGDCIARQNETHGIDTLCDDQSDLCYQNGIFVCERCLDNTVIGTHQVCDGVIDCFDLSDECLCQKESITSVNSSFLLCDTICYGGGSIPCSTCQTGEIFCPEENKCIKKRQVCDGILDCQLSQYDEKFCEKKLEQKGQPSTKTFVCDELPMNLIEALRKQNLENILEIYNNSQTATKCDGKPECLLFEDECGDRANCSLKQDACKRISALKANITAFGLSAIDAHECEHSDTHSVCNGIKDCQSGIDEAHCPNRFQCRPKRDKQNFASEPVSIPREKKCDGVIDCSDNSDERNCPVETHFYCESGMFLFVKRDQVGDGTTDCEDNSDECPGYDSSKSPVLSRKELSASKFKVIFLVMGFAAFIGNGVVIFKNVSFHVSAFRKSPNRKPSSCRVINNLLILNLAVADFLMAVVVVILLAKVYEFSGGYCVFDTSWRTSVACNSVGVITLLSSEVSLLTLICLTSYRVYLVIFPTRGRSVNTKFLCFWIPLTWVASSLIAFAPFFHDFSLSMIKTIWIKTNPFFINTEITWKEKKTFAERLVVLNNSLVTEDIYENWYSLENYFKTNYFPQEPKTLGYFSYYSTSGLCIPRFFKTDHDPSDLNDLSLFIVFFNFLALMYIIGANIKIYSHSTKSNQLSKKRRKQAKEMRSQITALLVTAATCWLPISIFTFASLSGTVIPAETYSVELTFIFLMINSSVNPFIYTKGSVSSTEAESSVRPNSSLTLRPTIK